MNNDFQDLMNSLLEEQKELNARIAEAKGQAIQQVQELINVFQLKPEDLFNEVSSSVQKVRRPAVMKYRLPNGVEWSGRGRMKKEFEEYLINHELTEKDLDQFKIKMEIL